MVLYIFTLSQTPWYIHLHLLYAKVLLLSPSKSVWLATVSGMNGSNNTCHFHLASLLLTNSSHLNNSSFIVYNDDC